MTLNGKFLLFMLTIFSLSAFGQKQDELISTSKLRRVEKIDANGDLQGKTYARKDQQAVHELIFEDANTVTVVDDGIKYTGTYSISGKDLDVLYRENVEIAISFLVVIDEYDNYLLKWSENDVPMETDIRYYLDK